MKLVITAHILFINLLIGRRPQTTKTTRCNRAEAGGEHEKAYDFLFQLQEVGDSLFNIENARQIANLEIRERLLQKKQEHERQKRKIERVYWIAVAGLLLILLLVLIYLNLQKNKIIRSEEQRQQLTKKRRFLEAHISRQKEILTEKEHKVENLALKIEEKNQNILSLEERIGQINSTLRKHIDQHKISNLINPNQPSPEKEKERKKLLLRLEQISIPLADKLEDRFGNLTTRQKLLAALIKQKFTAKEIAILFNISHRSVQTAKYRLKKKFKLTAQENLETFLKDL